MALAWCVRRFLGVIDSKILSALKSDDLHYIKETIPESFPFNIEDDPRAQFVRFTGENVREEHVQVLAFMPSLVADEPISIKLIVTVTKKSGLCLEFSCTAFADSINIDIVSVNHPGGFFEGTLKNDWHFNCRDMDNDLKKMFYEYLETVVEASTTNFLHKYMMSKLKREY
ncbi:Mitochondrial glycoprotein superfamily, partial [Arabidopsis thaliana x Arabidopsis arenosa]